ncbi:Hint domain-containing protein [Ruegeria sp. ANG10]|uniref:Hint domain-containing protein n=1 Tax=Ruegeria sp. ANG10 TaxID=3042467 RepID=UPI003454F09F
MPTAFTVFSLGNQQIWDTAEGNQTLSTGAVNSSLGTYGSAGNPLFDSRQTFAEAGSGFSGGDSTAYDLDNNVSNDQFSIDGGSPQSFDAAMQFDAVITYTDGSTVSITAVVFQDTNGNTYWAPEFQDNADQDAIDASAIESIQLVSPIYANGFNTGYSLFGDRADSDPLCFVRGALIACPDGPRPIESLKAGDQVLTMDSGAQPIRWIGRRTMAAIGKFAPIRIRAGVLGAEDTFEVSPQHRLLLQGADIELQFASPQVLAAAKYLVDGDGISVRIGGEVEYFHLLFDDHQIVWANGVASESLLLGKAGTATLDEEDVSEIQTLFPELDLPSGRGLEAARPVLRSYEASLMAAGRSTENPGALRKIA